MTFKVVKEEGFVENYLKFTVYVKRERRVLGFLWKKVYWEEVWFDFEKDYLATDDRRSRIRRHERFSTRLVEKYIDSLKHAPIEDKTEYFIEKDCDLRR